ncbi:plasmid replication protein RepC [Bartonella schoenbuchensis]|uniref:Replication initiation protein RepC n=1 Tax=Bartonella schoenbuchensis (strain DSM 13525 / NCTC 13165 / R1) TaxID=687861 RepID=E6Z0N8_BARSR|nr:plasmid replication protein RepC [Bartonella schoenbuchensis]AQX31570.1 replication initiation protein RepC [Bartonella schoenbuchensis R1]CBI82676.1 Replication protein C [Bartonella schoenbuchensis R1]
MVNKTSGRRLNAKHLEYMKIADHAEIGSINRSQLIILARQLPITGLIKGTEAHLLSILLNTAPIASFEQGGIPVIFKSNRQIASEIGCTVVHVSRLLSRLYDKGLIVMRDSGNFKRFPVNYNGSISIACGIDLSILVARYHELQNYIYTIKEEQDLQKDALRRFRGIYRQLRSKITESTQISSIVLERVKKIMTAVGVPTKASFSKLEKAIRLFNWLLNRFFSNKMLCTYIENVMHIHNTNPYHICKSNTNTQKTNHPSKNKITIMNSDKSEYSKINATFSRSKNNSERDTREAEQTLLLNGGALPQIKPETLVSAMPNVSEFLDNKLNSVDDLVNSTDFLAKMTGISPDALKHAKITMGFKKAALAVGIILEKYARQIIYSPGGYLRGMIDKQKRGELYLERSIYGLLNSDQQTVAEK